MKSKRMNVNVNFYGYTVDVNPEDIISDADLSWDSTDALIKAAVDRDISEAVHEEYPAYRHDGEDVIDRIKEILQERKEEEEAEAE